MYVTCKLFGGLGNRLFQIAAMLGYAEQFKHKAVFVKEWIVHNADQPGGNSVMNIFPDIPTISAGDLVWTDVTEPGEACMTYRPLYYVEGNVKLTGCFQSERYFPKGGVKPQLLPKMRWYPTFFLHIRRGDYLHPMNRHHYVELGNYYRRALELFPNGSYILVCSDDIEWCKATLPKIYSFIGADKWIWFMGDEYATLSAMMGCTLGGICANSTFSWWGAYLNPSRDKLVSMPDVWIQAGRGIPKALDIYPAWAEKVPV